MYLLDKFQVNERVTMVFSLKEQVKQICDRLVPYGWGDLLKKHGLNICKSMTADDLEKELLKNLDKIDRKLKGFEDFSLEGFRGIEPGKPARSLLYHALASPNVTVDVDDSELKIFPTMAEIEIVENYVFGIKPPKISEIESRVNENEKLAVVVFASEYRPAPETVHRKHADLCLSRTGVARVGNTKELYIGRNRGFFPDVEGDDFAFRVLPCKYSAYIAVKRNGNEKEFGPMRFINGDDSDNNREFWVPLHKLFTGLECLKNEDDKPIDLKLTLKANHVNEKIKKIHQILHAAGKVTKWGSNVPNEYPFIFHNGIAEWSNNLELGSNVLVPIPHLNLVEPAIYKNEKLSFTVPTIDGIYTESEGIRFRNFSSSLEIRMLNSSGDVLARPAPEYVHVRHEVLKNGEIKDLNTIKDKDMVENFIKAGGYQALHYVDYTGDGWIEVDCPQINNHKRIVGTYAAYSIITAIDYFPNCDQRELMDWFESKFLVEIQDGIWLQKPKTLSDDRLAANIELNAGFDIKDDTMTAIVSLPLSNESPEDPEKNNVPSSVRHSYLPDAASGIYAPGWDVSTNLTTEGKKFLAAYGLGSPFPEDAKLCAALSTFWPAVSPDAARTFEPDEEPHWPTVAPLTDKEIGQEGNLPWDGVPGPRIVDIDGIEKVEYISMAYVDYVNSAIKNKFTLSLTKLVDVEEYKSRVLAMSYVYITLDISLKAKDNYDQKKVWNLLSFREIQYLDSELQLAQEQAEFQSFGKIKDRKTVYRFELFNHICNSKELAKGEQDGSIDYSRYHIGISEKTICFVNGNNILIKHGNRDWEAKKIIDWKVVNV
ncbi:hypothetical protein ACQCWI_22455 [Bacillus thuringiensis]|uniref:hypothetical protein n=2 Tax=Bacillus TaxID=1386 RepID=UPI003CF80C02